MNTSSLTLDLSKSMLKPSALSKVPLRTKDERSPSFKLIAERSVPPNFGPWPDRHCHCHCHCHTPHSPHPWHPCHAKEIAKSQFDYTCTSTCTCTCTCACSFDSSLKPSTFPENYGLSTSTTFLHFLAAVCSPNLHRSITINP